jgi:hypothetical protein
MGVGEMLGKMTSMEITEWWAYFALEAKDREESRMASEADRKAKEAANRAKRGERHG